MQKYRVLHFSNTKSSDLKTNILFILFNHEGRLIKHRMHFHNSAADQTASCL